ncbi:MAG: TetR/AcrR family transcriptional regulator [Pseudomonadota bacterium]
MNEPSPAAPLWKEPVQARGRAKFNAILDAACDVALEAGHLDFKMTAVAERAGVPIGSVYQFFPNQTSLLARLFAREMEPIDRSLEKGLAGAQSIREVIDGIGAMTADHVALVARNPALSLIWSTPALSPVLQQADLVNSRNNAAKLAARLMELAGREVDADAVQATALLVCHLWGSVIRLCASTDNPQAVLDQYTHMLRGHFQTILEA